MVYDMSQLNLLDYLIKQKKNQHRILIGHLKDIL